MKIITWTSIMLVIMLSAVLSSADGTGRITGHVFNPATQTPVKGATVSVEGTSFSTRTGADGAYSIANVPAGVYLVRVEKAGIVHAGVGKASFSEQALAENIRALTDAVSRAKPSGAKGTYLKRISLASTQGPGVKIDPASLVAG